jgi:hypothetical protein
MTLCPDSEDLKLNPAIRRYTNRRRGWMALYVVCILGAAFWARAGHRSGAISYAIAMLPGLTVIGLLASVGLYLKEERDEFQRAIHVQAILWATGLTLGIATTWGFLQDFTDLPKAPLYLIFALFCVVWAFALPMVRRRYQ